MAEAPVNGVGTTLASSITTSSTTLPLTSATGFTNAQYHVLITDGTNYEIALATALSGSNLTVTRAVETYNGATGPYAFSAGASVTVVQSVGSVANFINSQPYLSPTGLTGATAASRYVGSTTSGAPTSGTFAVGDFVIDQTGKVWVCISAGTPGTWSTQPTLTTSTATVSANVSLAQSTSTTVLTSPSLAVGTYLVNYKASILIGASGESIDTVLAVATGSMTFAGQTSDTCGYTTSIGGGAISQSVMNFFVTVTSAGTFHVNSTMNGAATASTVLATTHTGATANTSGMTILRVQ